MGVVCKIDKLESFSNYMYVFPVTILKKNSFQAINQTPSDKDVFVSVSGNHEWRSKNNSGKYKFHSIFKNAPSFERAEKTETGQRFFLWYSGKARFKIGS